MPFMGYSMTGRGYPDISLAAANYIVSIGGEFYPVSGTSASAPAFAGYNYFINYIYHFVLFFTFLHSYILTFLYFYIFEFQNYHSMVSLVNAGRMKAGKPPLGYLNAAIYAHAPKFSRDIGDKI